jgi:hypothetical protein
MVLTNLLSPITETYSIIKVREVDNGFIQTYLSLITETYSIMKALREMYNTPQ